MEKGLTKQMPDAPNTRIVDVAGVKMEVDMRHAIKVEHYKVGTLVRILKKSSSYGEDYKVYGGVIVGFDQFEKMPSILIAYLSSSYSTAEIEFLSFNSKTKDVEMCPADENFIPFQKGTIIEILDNKILEAEQQLLDAKAKKEYFEKREKLKRFKLKYGKPKSFIRE